MGFFCSITVIKAISMKLLNIDKGSCGNIRDTGYVAIQQPTTSS